MPSEPLVLLHAFPLTSAMFAEQHRLLGDEWQLITPDLRGFGTSPLGNDEPSIDAYADDVVAELERLGVDRAVMGGVSIGGYIIMSLLRRHPDRVAAVVLADTKASADTEQAAANRRRIADKVLAENSVQVVVDELVPRLVGSTTQKQRREVLGRVTDIVRSASPAAVAWAQRAMAQRPDSHDALAQVSVPALVLVGAEDELTPLADAQAMVDVMSDAQLVTVPRAGHLSPIEAPTDFAAAVRQFVRRVSRE